MHERYRGMVCKFCRKPVRYDRWMSVVVEPDSDTPHADNCPKRRAHYSQQAADAAQIRRNKRL